MKNKDVANYREEAADLESRLGAKTNELRTVKTQMQVVQSRYEEAMQEVDQLQAGRGRRPDQAQGDPAGPYQRQIDFLKQENQKLKETMRGYQGGHHSKMMSFGQEKDLLSPGLKPHQEEDLVAHFENFNMEQLGASGGNMHRSLTERQASPPGGRKAGDPDGLARGEEPQRRSLKEELDLKKVRLLELETENGELRTIVEQMTKAMQTVKDQAAQKEGEGQAGQNEQVYELRRELFRLQQDLRRLELENEMLRSSDRVKKEEQAYQEVARLENTVEDQKAELSSREREIAQLMSKNRQLGNQVSSLRHERDRLLEVSSDLKVQLSQSEKKKLQNFSAGLQGIESRSQQQPEDVCQRFTSLEAPRRSKVGSVLTYGGNEPGAIGAEKQADIGALRDEVDQIRSIMDQLRYSGASSGT